MQFVWDILPKFWIFSGKYLEKVIRNLGNSVKFYEKKYYQPWMTSWHRVFWAGNPVFLPWIKRKCSKIIHIRFWVFHFIVMNSGSNNHCYFIYLIPWISLSILLIQKNFKIKDWILFFLRRIQAWLMLQWPLLTILRK